jgi:ABC-type branched-subunit amino acid transport system ATPase component
MKRLSKNDILSADDLKHEDVEVPEWGGTVTVRTFTGDERDKFEASLIGPDGKAKATLAGVRAKLVSLTVIDEKGELLFSEADVGKLGRKSAKALDRVFSAAQKLNGLSKADVDALKND